MLIYPKLDRGQRPNVIDPLKNIDTPSSSKPYPAKNPMKTKSKSAQPPWKTASQS